MTTETTIEQEALLTAEQVAKLCAVKRRTILRWLRQGRLQGIRLTGQTTRFRRADVVRLMSGKGGV